jgi:hypothetical protein
MKYSKKSLREADREIQISKGYRGEQERQDDMILIGSLISTYQPNLHPRRHYAVNRVVIEKAMDTFLDNLKGSQSTSRLEEGRTCWWRGAFFRQLRN